MSKKKKQKLDVTPYEDRAQLCPCFGICGGCSYQKVSYDKQLEIKSEEVKKLITGVYPEFFFEGILPSPSETGYRNKMEFTFGDTCKGGPFALGLHQRGSYMNIVDIRECILVHPDMNLIRNTVRDFFAARYEAGRIDFRNNRTQKGYLRHLLIRRAAKSGQILTALVTASPEKSMVDGFDEPSEKEMLAELQEILLELDCSGKLEGHLTGILHITNDSASDVVRSDKTEILFGSEFIQEEILGLKFKISPFSFFQTNTLGAELLYRKAREYANESGEGAFCHTLFDLYSGTGTIAQLMAPAAESVIGVEIVGEAVKAAKENAALNGVDNVTFIEGDVLKVLEDLPVPDAIILDPPREGINPKALGKILNYGVDHIVYVSCKPTSLARDLESFQLAGYALKKACCVDMFPQTPHVETCVLLSKLSEAKHHIAVKIDMDEMDLTAAEGKATYKQIHKKIVCD